MHFGISEGKGGGVKTWKSSMAGYGYFLELPNIGQVQYVSFVDHYISRLK